MTNDIKDIGAFCGRPAGDPPPVYYTESAYRRGFIQGIQFALNSLHDGDSVEAIKKAQTEMHRGWRGDVLRYWERAKEVFRVMAPMSVREYRFHAKDGWPTSHADAMLKQREASDG